jgi:hypothetical protein
VKGSTEERVANRVGRMGWWEGEGRPSKKSGWGELGRGGGKGKARRNGRDVEGQRNGKANKEG